MQEHAQEQINDHQSVSALLFAFCLFKRQKYFLTKGRSNIQGADEKREDAITVLNLDIVFKSDDW